jgi:DNA-binding CsgD family transcriptional regulator
MGSAHLIPAPRGGSRRRRYVAGVARRGRSGVGRIGWEADLSSREHALVGRARESQTLSSMLDALGSDRGGALLQIAGEPGIGKTRLLRELCSGARERGYLVVAGRAAEFEGELPFGMFNDALDDWLMSLDRGSLEALAGGLVAELAVVLRAFERVATGRVLELQEERYRAHRALRLLLSAIARDTPVVLVLDDVHWADPGSVELLCHLLAHPTRGPVLLALGFRPSQVSAKLGATLAAALRDHDGRRLDLSPLSRAAARELMVSASTSSSDHERLYHASGGNPFFLLQLVRASQIDERRAAGRSTVGEDVVPQAVGAALTSELSSLSAPSLVLLQGAAVTGDPFDALTAADAAAIADADVLDLLDELLRFGLIYRTGVAREYAFRHPIVRATVYALTSSGWRAHAHARVAEVLAARGASAAACAPHVERSAMRGNPDAIAVLVAAAESTMASAPALAARWWAAALRLLPATPDVEDHRVELSIAMASAHVASGDLEEARRILCEILERLPAEDPSRVSVTAFCAGVEHMLGRNRAADARLLEAYRQQPDVESPAAVRLQLELAGGCAYQDRYEEMLDWAQQALAGAAARAMAAEQVTALGQIALARYLLALPAGDATDRAATALDALDDDQLAGRLDIGLWVGWSESVMERHQQALAHCDRVIDVCRASGQGAALVVTTTAKAWALIDMGRLDDADETLTAAIDAGRLAPHVFLAVAIGLWSIVKTYKGDYDAAVRAAEESVGIARTADPGMVHGMSALYLAIALIETGDAQRARDILLEMSDGGVLQTARSGRTAAYEILTRAELALGNTDAAENWARKALDATHGAQLTVEATFAHRANARVALARDNPAKAAKIALDAAARAEGAGAPVEAARCRMLAAEALTRSGQRAEATAELEHAVAQLRRVAAHGFQRQAEAQLRQLEPSTNRSSSPVACDLGLLSERELQIAELVRAGHTNREIARAIHVSEKTVERDVSRIFAKLGVSSRTALAVRIGSAR